MTTTFNSKKYGTITVTKTRITGSFKFKTDKEVTQEEAKHIQKALNYHPNGYGFYDFNGTSWTSFNKC